MHTGDHTTSQSVWTIALLCYPPLLSKTTLYDPLVAKTADFVYLTGGLLSIMACVLRNRVIKP